MAKIKLTKGELKKQRDALRQYLRYLPTLQLKKQQLQMEILHQVIFIDEKIHSEQSKRLSCEAWSGLLKSDSDINPVRENTNSLATFSNGVNITKWLKPKKVIVTSKNIAGVDLPVFERLEFEVPEYDLFIHPLWVDSAIDFLRAIVSLREEIEIIKKEIEILRQELRITTQRVNLFEKVKIPEAEEVIRLIKIYLGDQMANAVGRSKIAKKKIEQAELEEVFV